jgi:hypothetical protein
MNARSELIRKTFNELSKDHMEVIDGFYDEQVTFEDPLGRIEGRAGMHEYYGNMYKNVQKIRFDFTNEIVQGDSHVVVWSMHLWASGLNKGKEVIVVGNSLIQFGPSGKVLYHRDFFDMGAFVYEHIPLLRWAIRKIKHRLSHSANKG